MADPRFPPGADGGVSNQNDGSDGGAGQPADLVREALIAEILAWWNAKKSSGGHAGEVKSGKSAARQGGQPGDGKAPESGKVNPEGKTDKPDPVKLEYQKPGAEKQLARPALPPEKDPQVVGERQEAAARHALAESHRNLKVTQDNANPRVFPYREQFTVARELTLMEIAREQLGPKATRDQLETFAHETLYLNKLRGDLYTGKIAANSIIRLPGQNADGGITFRDGDMKVTRWHDNSLLTAFKDGNGFVTIPGDNGSERQLHWSKQTLGDNFNERRTGNMTIEKRADGSGVQRYRSHQFGEWQVVRLKTTDDKGRTLTQEYTPGQDSPRKVTVTDKNNVVTTFLRNARGELLNADGQGISGDSKMYRLHKQADGSTIRAYEDGAQERYDSRGNILSRHSKDERGRLIEEHFNRGEKEPYKIKVTMTAGEPPLEFTRTAAGRYVSEYKTDGRTIGTIETIGHGLFEYNDKVNQIVRRQDHDGRLTEILNLPHANAKTVESKDGERLITEKDRNGVIKSEIYENARTGSTVAKTFDSAGRLLKVAITDRDATMKLQFDRDLSEFKGEQITRDGKKERVILRDDFLIFPDSPDANGDVRVQRLPSAFSATQESAGGKYNADTGQLRYWRHDGGQRIDSVAPGRTDIVKADGTIEGGTATGEKSYVKPTGEAVVEHADGTKVRLNADGTIDRWGPSDREGARREPLSNNEKAFLDKHRGNIDLRDLAEIHRRLRGDRVQLDAFYAQLNKIDDARNLSPAERNALRRNIMRHVGDPADISQGNAFACNVSVVQRDLAINSPTKYAAMLVSAVSDGSLKTADGTDIKLNPDNLKLSDASGRDLASRIFQTAALNVVAHPGSFQNTEDGAGRFLDKDGNRRAFNGLVNAEIANLMQKLTGQERALVKISSAEDLLIAFEKNGGGPMIINVDGSKAPIAKENSPGHGGHVLTVTRIDKGPPMKVYVQNQWGLENDHSTPDRALGAEELIENMKRREGDAKAIIKGAHLKVFKVSGRNLVEDKEATKIVAQDFEARKQ